MNNGLVRFPMMVLCKIYLCFHGGKLIYWYLSVIKISSIVVDFIVVVSFLDEMNGFLSLVSVNNGKLIWSVLFLLCVKGFLRSAHIQMRNKEIS